MLNISELGGVSRVARALGLAAPTVHGWRRVPVWHCPDLERLHEGRITAESLRPDARWVRIPDASWPHPDGRPLLDVAAKYPLPAKAPQP